MQADVLCAAGEPQVGGGRRRVLLLAISLLTLSIGCESPTKARSVPEWRVRYTDGGSASGLNVYADQTAYYPQLLSHDRDLYVTWYESAPDSGIDQIRVAKFTGYDSGNPAWDMVDGGGPRGINVDVNRAARWSRLISFGNRLYAYWYEEDGSGTTRIRVAVRTGESVGSSWVFVDNGGLNASLTHQAAYASLAVHNGKLYAVWQESNGSAYQIRFSVYNGEDAAPTWTPLDGSGAAGTNFDPNKDAYYPKLFSGSGALYRLWPEKSAGYQQMRSARYNGDDSNPEWSSLDLTEAGGISFDEHRLAHSPSLVLWQGHLVGTWHEDSPISGAGVIRAARLIHSTDGGVPSWRFIDGKMATGLNQSPGADAEWSRTAVVDDTLFVAWSESTTTGDRIQLAALPRTEADWIYFPIQGLNFFERSNAEVPHLATHDGKLFVTWSERAGGYWHSRVATVELTL